MDGLDHLMALFFSGTGVCFCLGLLGFALYEFYALYRGRQPITFMVRQQVRSRPRLSLLILGFALMLIAHFLWH